MSDCIFCKIANKELPSQLVYEDEYVVCVKDINPMAPVHLLILPKIHIGSANEFNEENSLYAAKAFCAAAKITKELGIAEDGYRIINNCGENGGQSVRHVHFHVLGGKKLPLELA